LTRASKPGRSSHSAAGRRNRGAERPLESAEE
jgi:hypothetical protein